MIFLRKPSLFIYFSLISSSWGLFLKDAVEQSPLDPGEDASYARLIFQNGTERYFRPWECPDGIWSEEQFSLKQQPKCICVKGAYAISKGLCDEGFEILTGDEHCYDISKTQIRRISPLLGQSGLKGRASTVFRKDGAYFARLISPTPVSETEEAMAYLFRLNDPHDFTVYASLDNGGAGRLACFKGQAVGKNATIMQVAVLPDCANEFRGAQAWCKEDGQYSAYATTIPLGQKWSPKGTLSPGSLYPGSCKSGSSSNRINSLQTSSQGKRKSGTRSNGGGKRKARAVKDKSDSKLKQIKMDLPEDSEKGTTKDPSKSKGDNKRDKNNHTTTENPMITSTRRSSKAKANVTYDRCLSFPPGLIDPPISGPISAVETFVDRIEYKNHYAAFHTWERYQRETNEQTASILRKALVLHLGEADARADQLLNSISLPAFRLIQLSRQVTEKVCPEEKVPSFVLRMMVRLFRLIWLDLGERVLYPEVLLVRSETSEGIVKALGECRDKLAVPLIFNSNETCPGMGLVNITQNTTTDPKIWTVGDNLHELPEDIKWTTGSVDFPLETVWKMMLLTHYTCASAFSDPILHSQFAVKVENFLSNPHSLYRWYHPGPANRLLRALLSPFDLSDFARSLDRCVATARDISPYTDWLTRPANLFQYEKKFDPNMLTTNGPGKGMSTNEKIKAAKKSFFVRRKRDYFQNNLWDEQAYCLRNSKAIVTEVRSTSLYSCKSHPKWFLNTDNF